MSRQRLKAMQDAIRGCEQMDLKAISDILHSDLVRVTRPNSLNVPKHNKDQCVEYYRKLFDNWAKIEPPTVTVMANSAGKVVVHVTSSVMLKSGPVVPYESIISCSMDEDSSGNMKIKYAEEFMDAKTFNQAFAPFL